MDDGYKDAQEQAELKLFLNETETPGPFPSWDDYRFDEILESFKQKVLKKVRIDIHDPSTWQKKGARDITLSRFRNSIGTMDMALTLLGEYDLIDTDFHDDIFVSDLAEAKAMREQIDNIKNLLVECSHG